MKKINNEWKYLYKIDYRDRTLCKTNLLYTPYVNVDGSVLCIDYEINIDYQKGEIVSEELTDYFFKKEVTYLTKFQGRSWVPKLLKLEGKKIYIEFNEETLNHVLLSNKDLDSVLPDWKDQINEIMLEIDNAGYFKLALYPHSFFIGKDNKLKVLDFYTFIEKAKPLLPRKFIEGMIGKMSEHRFNEATINNDVDFRIFFNNSLNTHLLEYWGEINPFPAIYKKLITKN